MTKVAVLAATDGDDSLVVGLAVPLPAALGITLGASWVGVRLAGERPLPLVVVLGALGPLLAFVAYDSVLDPLAKAALGDAGPAWFEDEAGILADRPALARGQPPGRGSRRRPPRRRRARPRELAVARSRQGRHRPPLTGRLDELRQPRSRVSGRLALMTQCATCRR